MKITHRKKMVVKVVFGKDEADGVLGMALMKKEPVSLMVRRIVIEQLAKELHEKRIKRLQLEHGSST